MKKEYLKRDRALRPDQAATIMNVSRRTVYRMVEDGNFVCFHIRGSLRILENSVYAHIQEQIEKKFLET